MSYDPSLLVKALIAEPETMARMLKEWAASDKEMQAARSRRSALAENYIENCDWLLDAVSETVVTDPALIDKAIQACSLMKSIINNSNIIPKEFIERILIIEDNLKCQQK